MALNPPPLPSMATFPTAAWRNHLVPEEWEASLDAWISLAEAHLSLAASDFSRISTKDESVVAFLISYASEAAMQQDIALSADLAKAKALRRQCFFLTYRFLEVHLPPGALLQWEFLADLSKIYGKHQAAKLLRPVWKRHSSSVETSMGLIKSSLITELEAGLKGDLKTVEIQLKRLNHLLYASPEAAAYFMAGSDFLDALISCYKLMNPPLRKTIISTTYLCLIGLTEGSKPNFSSLFDQLYSLKTTAEAHRAGPTNINDSLVAELVSVTPILKQIQQRVEASGSGSNRAKSSLTALEEFRKPGVSGRPVHLIRRKINKGKGLVKEPEAYLAHQQLHIHRMSLVSQIQDLFPELGSGFVVQLLDEYSDDVEQVIAHLLEGSLPTHLKNADRSASLDSRHQVFEGQLPSRSLESLPGQLPSRRNVFDDDDFDRLAFDTSRLHFGRKNPDQTADEVLQDRSTAPNKAAILSALAAFDSDDDERDDTYDVADVGGTVDSVAPGNNREETNGALRDGHDEMLFQTFKLSPNVFTRDAAARRGKQRMALREETGMTDEAIEGWALMLSRDPRRMRRLEAKYSTFSGEQLELAPTSWRASPAGSGTEDSDIDGNNRGRGGLRRGGGRGGRGAGGRGRGNVSGPTGDRDTEVARQRKEANKGSRANHNRRDQRAKKMARGGFPG